MSPSAKDRLAGLPFAVAAFAVAGIVLLIAAFLVRESQIALGSVQLARFISDPGWHPTPRAADGAFNLAPMVLGTLLSTLGAMLIAAPLGLLSAVFRHDYAPRPLAAVYQRMIELLAGIPSVVFGLWGLVTLVPLIRLLAPPGPSLLAAILILTLMVLPTVALFADAAIAAVPHAHRQAAAALGLSRARTVWCVVVPAARGGIYGGACLAAGRALGETMAVLMVSGNVVQAPGSLLDPVRTLTANIALEMAYAMHDHRSALFVSGLLLALVVSALVFSAHRAAGGRLHA